MATAKPPVASVWTRPAKKREQPVLTRERIVEEAIALLDADGIEALSMRTLGQRLNAGATSLYRHVANKDELIELVVDEVYGEVDVPALDDVADWREGVVLFARRSREVLLRHRWMASVIGQAGMAYLGPNMMGTAEAVLKLYEAAGFEGPEANFAMQTVSSYMVGVVVTEAAWLSAIERTGMTEKEWIDSTKTAIREQLAGNELLTRTFDAQVDVDPEADRDAAFEYGLAVTLDGLDTRLRAQ